MSGNRSTHRPFASQDTGAAFCATRWIRKLAPLPLMMVCSLAGTASATVIHTTWNAGTDGSWGAPASWTPAGVPNNGGTNFYHVRIDSSAASVTVTMGGSYTIDRLRVDGGDRVVVANGQQFQVNAANGAGVIENLGTVEVGSTGSHTYLMPRGGPVTLQGGGTLLLSNTTTNWVYKGDGLGSFVNLDNTIRGAGNLGWSGSAMAITNAGSIIADQSNPLLVNGSGGMANTGMMRAVSGGTLLLNEGSYVNTGGVIEALAGSIVDLGGSSAISGGTLQTSGDGVIRSNGTPSLDDVTNLGLIEVPNDRRILLRDGTIQNQGTIRLNSSGSNTYLQPAGGAVSLSGGGTVELSNSSNNWIFGADGAGSLVNLDNTIRGSGNLGWSGSAMSIENAGVIIADQSTPLVVNGSGGMTNGGTMRAVSGGTLLLNEGSYDNAAGSIEATAGSHVDLDGSSAISGGTLQTSGDGSFRAISTGSPSLDDLANLGLVEVLNGRRLVLRDGVIENQGTIRMSSAGADTYLRMSGGVVTLSGGGLIELSNSSANWIYKADPLGSLVNLDNTIRGAGNIGWSGSATAITNAGSIIADQTTPLVIDSGSEPFTNSGTARAQASATLRCNQTPANYSSGTLTGGKWEAVGGTLRLQGVNVVTNAAGILLDGPGSNIYNATSGTNSALANFATNATSGSFTIQNGRNFTTSGAFSNAGSVTVQEGCTFTSTGAYTQTDGFTMVGGTFNAPSPIDIQGGILGGNGIVNADVTNARRVSPGASIGSLTINGDYEQLSEYGRLVIEIGGTSSEQIDRLDVVGQAVLAGYLEVVAVDGFEVQAGDSFQILTSSSRQGEFEPAVACLAPGICFDVVYGPTDVTLVAYALDPADVEEEAPLPTGTRFYTASSVGTDCRLHLDLPSAAHVDLRVFDLTGRQVARLWDGWESAGTHMYRWSGVDRAGRRSGSGIYFARAVVRSSGTVYQETLRLPTIR